MLSSRDYSLDDLLSLVAQLRDPETGCPWDLKQTFKSIVPHTIEETYEVVEAIEAQDWAHLAEELGDLLFQIALYAQFGREQGCFEFADIVHLITAKMLRRHPHVFPEGTLNSRRVNIREHDAETVASTWAQIKDQEAVESSGSCPQEQSMSVLDGVPMGMPALMQAAKLQRKASRVGFDWSSAQEVLAKLKEEIAELEEAIQERVKQEQSEQARPPSSYDAVADELGDVMFCCVNLARHLKLDPEQTVRAANTKFVRRFQFVETKLVEAGRSVDMASREELEQYWCLAKSLESSADELAHEPPRSPDV